MLGLNMGRGQGQSSVEGAVSLEAQTLPLSEVAHLVGEQVQYLSRYHTGVGGSIVLSDGLRLSGNDGDYHSLRIHSDDVEEFARRVVRHRIDQHVLTPAAMEDLEERISARRAPQIQP